MPRSRKLWKPPAKPKVQPKPERKTWKPERAKPVPAPSPNKSKRVLADVSQIKAARHEHGWRFEDVESRKGKKGKRIIGERWTCDYTQPDGVVGCKSFVWQHEPGAGEFHAWDCPYWHLEGKGLTPF